MEMQFFKLTVLATLAVLGGCATQGPPEMMSETFPRGEVITLVAHNQSVPSYLLDREKLKLNYFIRGSEVNEEQLLAIAKTEKMCRFHTRKAQPSNLVAVLSSGILYAIAGFAGVGSGSQVFDGAKFLEYGPYGAAATGMAGVASGTIALAGNVYTFENCGKDILADLSSYGVRVLNRNPY